MNYWQYAMDLLRLLLGNAWRRTGSALTLIGATALTGWIDQLVAHVVGFKLNQTAPWIGFTVMATGIAMLWLGRTRDADSTPNPHDVALMQEFRNLVPDRLLDFLSTHNFGTPWRRDALDGIAQIAEVWRGARYEFQDVPLNEALTRVKQAANKLEEAIAYGSWPMHNNAAMQTAMTDEDYRIGTQRPTIEKIAEMNRLKAVLLNEIDGLERLARGVMPV
jgi:hypothetical protein